MDCPCGSGNTYAACCEPIIGGARKAVTAEELMRARYTAYSLAEMDFLAASLHPDARADHDPDNAREWAENSEWHGLEIIGTDAGGADDETGTVEFSASYTYDGDTELYHEIAEFVRVDGVWHFRAGRRGVRKPAMRTVPKVGRNDPCPCGSGRKHKRCCGG